MAVQQRWTRIHALPALSTAAYRGKKKEDGHAKTTVHETVSRALLGGAGTGREGRSEMLPYESHARFPEITHASFKPYRQIDPKHCIAIKAGLFIEGMNANQC